MPVAFACLVTTILSASVYHCDVTPTVMGLLLSIKHLLFERVSASLILGSGAFSCFVVFWVFFPFPPHVFLFQLLYKLLQRRVCFNAYLVC